MLLWADLQQVEVLHRVLGAQPPLHLGRVQLQQVEHEVGERAELLGVLGEVADQHPLAAGAGHVQLGEDLGQGPHPARHVSWGHGGQRGQAASLASSF